jgi:LacI family transcriptional regulator
MKKASIRDVAREVGVSITTVSRALNGYNDVSASTKEKIREVVERLNYAPNDNARSLGGKATKVLALLVSGLQQREDSGFVFGMISGLYCVAEKNDYEFILLTTNGAKQKKMNYLQLCRLKNIEGVIISGIKMDDPYYTELAKSEIPCVVVDAEVEGENVCSLSINNAEAAYKSVELLIQNGHRKIAMVNGSSSAEVSKERYKGYVKAIEENGLELDLSYIKSCDFEEKIAYEKTIELLNTHPEITAFFCASDVMAIGVITAINSIGKEVPKDISVVGFDDIPAAKFVNGGLTTICQEPFVMGKKGGEALIAMIEENKKTSHINIPYTLVERKTVKSIR